MANNQRDWTPLLKPRLQEAIAEGKTTQQEIIGNTRKAFMFAHRIKKNRGNASAQRAEEKLRALLSEHGEHLLVDAYGIDPYEHKTLLYVLAELGLDDMLQVLLAHPIDWKGIRDSEDRMVGDKRNASLFAFGKNIVQNCSLQTMQAFEQSGFSYQWLRYKDQVLANKKAVKDGDLAKIWYLVDQGIFTTYLGNDESSLQGVKDAFSDRIDQNAFADLTLWLVEQCGGWIQPIYEADNPNPIGMLLCDFDDKEVMRVWAKQGDDTKDTSMLFERFASYYDAINARCQGFVANVAALREGRAEDIDMSALSPLTLHPQDLKSFYTIHKVEEVLAPQHWACFPQEISRLEEEMDDVEYFPGKIHVKAARILQHKEREHTQAISQQRPSPKIAAWHVAHEPATKPEHAYG